MPSELDVINFGLVEAQGVQITSLDQTIKSAGVARLLYYQARDAAMTAHRWNFSIQRASLPAMAQAPIFGFSYQYQRPADMLYLAEIAGYAVGAPSLGAVYNDETEPPFAIEGNAILTDFPAPLRIKGGFRIKNPNFWHPTFTEYMRWTLAELFTSALANRATERKAFYSRKKDDVLKEAMFANAVELPPEETDDGSWVLSRIGP